MFNRHSRRRNTRLSESALHLMMIPAVTILFVYAYLPMAGIVMAFQKFDISLGVSGFLQSEWVGFDNFRRIFYLQGSLQSFANTLVIAISKIVTMFFVPITFSILLNEIRAAIYKRSIQTLIYLPHFLSWVILGGIIKNILGTDGIVNQMVVSFGGEPIFFLGDAAIFQLVVVVSNLWKEVGFSTIVYLAAITGIDPELYEAATIDGADRWRQILHVTLPGMRAIIILTGVLSLGGILNAGFDQIFNLYSVPVYRTGDIIDTFVYRISFQGGQYSLGTAVGLLKSVVSFFLISLSYWLARRFANYEIF